MKNVIAPLIAVSLLSAATCLADIHMPPAADHGPTRKLSRAVANLAFGVTEIPYQIAKMNDQEGNVAACTYGVARGLGCTVRRVRYGVQELLLFPFPVNKGKYTQPYLSDDHWLSAGMSEFPHELGWDSKYDWCR